MAIGSEVFGRSVGEIGVSVVVKYEDGWLCYGLNYLRFILGKQSGSISSAEVGLWCQVLEADWGVLEGIEEIKSTCAGRCFLGLS